MVKRFSVCFHDQIICPSHLFQFSRFRLPVSEVCATRSILYYSVLFPISQLSLPSSFQLYFNGLLAWCYSFCLFLKVFLVHTVHSFYHIHPSHSLRFLSISSSLVSSMGKPSLECRAENRTQACLTASRTITNWATSHSDWATPHSNCSHSFPPSKLI